jgi:hypothetical protein
MHLTETLAEAGTTSASLALAPLNIRSVLTLVSKMSLLRLGARDGNGSGRAITRPRAKMLRVEIYTRTHTRG